MIDFNNFQRIGAPHNSGVGRSFEEIARSIFLAQGVVLEPDFAVRVGISQTKKLHKFDFGSEEPAVLVECKSHKWTSGGNIPSAKMTVWNEAMYYFFAASTRYRNIMFVLKHDRKENSLASYYLRIYAHLIPDEVEFWEYDEESKHGVRLR